MLFTVTLNRKSARLEKVAITLEAVSEAAAIRNAKKKSLSADWELVTSNDKCPKLVSCAEVKA